MKKFLAYFVIVVMMTVMLSSNLLHAQAASLNEFNAANVVSQTVEYFEDGSHATITVTEDDSAMTRATTYTKTGSKHYVMQNKDGDELWRFTINGTFSVNSGVSATCTKSTYSIKITEDAWQNDSASASKSGNQATGTATFIKKLLFITTDTRECSVVLSCDKNGNLS